MAPRTVRRLGDAVVKRAITTLSKREMHGDQETDCRSCDPRRAFDCELTEVERVLSVVSGRDVAKADDALYAASSAGVEIDLIIRGMCCLRPGVPGLSENIRVRSIVGRFLEHTRVYYFANDGKPDLYCSSADWMERNLFRRVETAFPVLDKKLAKRILTDLDLYLNDNTQAWELTAEGGYRRADAGETALMAQQALMES